MIKFLLLVTPTFTKSSSGKFQQSWSDYSLTDWYSGMEQTWEYVQNSASAAYSGAAEMYEEYVPADTREYVKETSVHFQSSFASEGLFQSLEDNYGILYFGMEQISCYFMSPAVSCKTIRRAYIPRNRPTCESFSTLYS